MAQGVYVEKRTIPEPPEKMEFPCFIPAGYVQEVATLSTGFALCPSHSVKYFRARGVPGTPSFVLFEDPAFFLYYFFSSTFHF